MPEVGADKLLDRLARGKPIPAILLCGSDAYLAEVCRAKIIETYVPEAARDWALARISVRESGWDDVLQRAQTMPMLAPTQVIIVDDVESFEKLGDKSRDAIVEQVRSYLESPPPFTVLLLEASALDGRQKLYKLLSEKALIVDLTISEDSAVDLALRMAKDLNTQIERGAATALCEIVNFEPARMRVELEKLAAYTFGRGPIVTADVEALVVAARKNTVWQLADMLASRRRGDALEFLHNLLREGEQPAGIVGALAWMYRKLIEARDLPAHTGGFQAARQLNMRPDAAEAAVRNAHRLPKKQLLAGLAALAEVDSRLKSGNPDPQSCMEFLIARLTSAESSASYR
jgi:DNA polymerase-3 subunit delta